MESGRKRVFIKEIPLNIVTGYGRREHVSVWEKECFLSIVIFYGITLKRKRDFVCRIWMEMTRKISRPPCTEGGLRPYKIKQTFYTFRQKPSPFPLLGIQMLIHWLRWPLTHWLKECRFHWTSYYMECSLRLFGYLRFQ